MKKILLLITLISSFNCFSQGLATEGFETWPATGWTEYHTGTDKLDQTTSQFYSGANSARFDFGNNETVDSSFLITPVINSLAPNSDLTFYEISQIGSSFGYYSGIWISVNGGSRFELQSLTVAPASWILRTIDLSAYAGDNIQLFFAYKGEPTGFHGDWNIDEVTVAGVISCPKPFTFSTTSITETGANLNWTNGGAETSWAIEYGPTGFTPGSGTTVIASSNPHTLSGLTAATDYDWYIKAICAVGDSSTLEGPNSFSTACPTYAIPYDQDFTIYQPACWTGDKGNIGNPTSFLILPNSAWNGDDYLNFAPNGQAAAFDMQGFLTDEWLFSPEINLGAGNPSYVVEFDLGIKDWNTQDSGYFDNDDSLAVVISTDAGATWNRSDILMVWDDANQPDPNGNRESISLAGYTGVIKLAFVTMSQNATRHNDVFVDNFHVGLPTGGCLTVYDTSYNTICDGDSILFGSNYYLTTGMYNDTLLTSMGCDSVQTLDLTVNSTDYTNIADTICQGGNIVFGGNTLTMAGTYYDTLTNSNTCDSIIELALVVNPPITFSYNDTICQGGNLVFGGNTLTMAGTYNDTTSTGSGCDSITELTLVVNPPITFSYNDTICQGGNLVFGGNTLTMAGTYNDTTSTGSGCDSITELTLIVTPPITFSYNDTICQGGNIVFGGNTLTMAGTYNDTASTGSGCDSITELTLIVTPPITFSYNDTICQGGNLVFGGNTLTMAGTYNDTTSSGSGCDSITELTLIVTPPATFSYNDTICQGGNLVFGGNTLTMAGTYNDTASTGSGCDSIIELTLVITPGPTFSYNDTICQGGNIVFGGNTLTMAGTYNDTASTGSGCDSIIELTLVITPGPTFSYNDTICQGGNIVFGGNTLTMAGTYNDTTSTGSGCDSITELTLVVTPPATFSYNDTICQGASIVFGGNTLTMAGTYNDTTSTGSGCDSITELTLVVTPPATFSYNDTICQGASIVFGGNTLTMAGTYNDTTSTGSGCDSIIELTLIVTPPATFSYNDTICQGASIVFGGNTLTMAGTYNDTASTGSGCDSIIELTLIVTPPATFSYNDTICQGASIVFGGNTLTMAGTYNDTASTGSGCDSIVELTLIVTPPATFSYNDTIQQGDTLIFGSQNLTVSGTYYDTSSTSNGCDSITELNLYVEPAGITYANDNICDGDSYTFGGNILTTGGVYTDTLTAISTGLDSIVELTLTINSVIVVLNASDDTIEAGTGVNFGVDASSNASNYFWVTSGGDTITGPAYGETFNTAGNFTVVLHGNLGGCSSTDTSFIVVLDSIVGIGEYDMTSNISLYPNPANNNITLDFNSDINNTYSIVMYNGVGQNLRSFTINNTKDNFIINLNGLENGNYFIKVSTDNHFKTIPFIISK